MLHDNVEFIHNLFLLIFIHHYVRLVYSVLTHLIMSQTDPVLTDICFTIVIFISGIFLSQNSLLAYYGARQVHKRAFGMRHNIPKSRSWLLINIYKF
jgi:hypothetical protein